MTPIASTERTINILTRGRARNLSRREYHRPNDGGSKLLELSKFSSGESSGVCASTASRPANDSAVFALVEPEPENRYGLKNPVSRFALGV